MPPQKCYYTHPHLPIVTKDGSRDIYGGSCLAPAVVNAHIYIGFERGMVLGPRRLPWIPGNEVCWPIRNLYAPDDPVEFFELVEWTWKQLAWGSKVHVGCIGGHGRTGLFLAAMVAFVMGRKDAIQYVREHYCCRAVETEVQIDFLVKHFLCLPVEPIYQMPATTSAQVAAEWAGK